MKRKRKIDIATGLCFSSPCKINLSLIMSCSLILLLSHSGREQEPANWKENTQQKSALLSSLSRCLLINVRSCLLIVLDA